MTTLALDLLLDAPPPVGSADADDGGARDVPGADTRQETPPAAEGRGRRTLDEIIVGVWEDLHAHHAATCPLCGQAMVPRYSAGPAPVGGRCTACGTAIE